MKLSIDDGKGHNKQNQYVPTTPPQAPPYAKNAARSLILQNLYSATNARPPSLNVDKTPTKNMQLPNLSLHDPIIVPPNRTGRFNISHGASPGGKNSTYIIPSDKLARS